jgi:hypothetical protein
LLACKEALEHAKAYVETPIDPNKGLRQGEGSLRQGGGSARKKRAAAPRHGSIASTSIIRSTSCVGRGRSQLERGDDAASVTAWSALSHSRRRTRAASRATVPGRSVADVAPKEGRAPTTLADDLHGC